MCDQKHVKLCGVSKKYWKTWVLGQIKKNQQYEMLVTTFRLSRSSMDHGSVMGKYSIW
jgi:hypothetical protein